MRLKTDQQQVRRGAEQQHIALWNMDILSRWYTAGGARRKRILEFSPIWSVTSGLLEADYVCQLFAPAKVRMRQDRGTQGRAGAIASPRR